MTGIGIGVGVGIGGLAAGAVTAPTTSFDPAAKNPNITLSNGNLTVKQTGSNGTSVCVRSLASHSSGKYYCEFRADTVAFGEQINIGIVDSTIDLTAGAYQLGLDGHSCGCYFNDNRIRGFTTAGNSGVGLTNGLWNAMAFDIDGGKLWFRDNAGVWQNSGDPAAGTNPSISAIPGATWFVLMGWTVINDQITWNFGATAYTFTPPVGFKNW